MQDILGDLTLQKVFKQFFKSMPKISKIFAQKSEELINLHDEEEDVEEVVEKISHKKKKNSRKNSEVLSEKSARKNSTENKILTKKTVRKASVVEESEEEVVHEKIKKNGKKIVIEETQNDPKVPFQRIKSNVNLHEDLQDNSYARHLAKTGDDYGKHANEKLIVTKGKDFKKEKTKFKNKSGSGGMAISMAVRSIQLDSD